MKTRTQIYLAVGAALCLYVGIASRYGYGFFDNPVLRVFRSSANALSHK
jgi:hypothetical protein